MNESAFNSSAHGSPFVCLADGDVFRRFDAPVRVLAARCVQDVVPVIAEAEREAAAGRTAVGFVTYEAAPAFDPALCVHTQSDMPLAWFAVYDGAGEALSNACTAPELPELRWTPAVDERAYNAALTRIREWIAAGDTYQVNFTYPTRVTFHGDTWALFRAMHAAQPTDLGMYVDLGRIAIASVSPELFFELDGDRIVTRPMKGTAPRGLWSDDDLRRGAAMRASEKERAENVMIVDMVRNDLGRIARQGSVHVASLFDTERHPTVWQMTSTVEARTAAPLAEIFGALFPSASVTGAPKIRTMQIIRELEPEPRGIYCGALGVIGPGRHARFSVGIRTAVVDRETRTASYHVGSGVTWDSIAAAEHTECRLKATVLRHRRQPFELIESLLWDGDYVLLDEHIERLRASSGYFGFGFDAEFVRRALGDEARGLRGASKVRLILGPAGTVRVESAPVMETRVTRVGLAAAPVDANDVFLYHKTTRRDVYDRARAARPELDDVILWNGRGEVTESTVANVVVRMGGEWRTPRVSCGLLPGVMRAAMLREGRIREARVSIDDFERADEVALINSVRRWIPATRVRAPEPHVTVNA